MIEVLDDIAAVERLGARIAVQLCAGDVVALSGPLGAGKTTLARAILRALGHQGDVPSPSFTLLEPYENIEPPVIHADFYRLDDPAEAHELGLAEYRMTSALIAEWPERAGGFADDPQTLSIALEFGTRGRRAIVEAGKDWLERLP